MKNIIIVILLFILICIPIQVISAQADTSNKYAVIIGNDNKPCAPVNGSNCARVLQGILLDTGFARKNIKMLLNHQATIENMHEAFYWLQEVATPDSEVIFAFFGHGSSQLILIHKWYIWHETIRDLLASIQSEKQLVIIDSCKSGGAIIEGNDGITLCAPNRIVLTSCATENDDSITTWKYTLWAENFLINGIKLGDSNSDGLVSIQEAYNWVQQSCMMGRGDMCDNYGEEFFL